MSKKVNPRRRPRPRCHGPQVRVLIELPANWRGVLMYKDSASNSC